MQGTPEEGAMSTPVPPADSNPEETDDFLLTNLMSNSEGFFDMGPCK
jgi:hypothetical protein